jgi:predicted phosphodiesterase
MKRTLRRTAGWLGRFALWTALGLAGALLGLRVAGPLDRETALGGVTLRVAPSLHGQVDAYIPIADWGIRARAFHAPLRVRVEPRGLDRQAVLRAAGGDKAILRAAEKDGQKAAAVTFQRAIAYAAGGVILAAALSALLRAVRPRPPGRPGALRIAGWALAPLVIGIGLIVVVVLRAQATFDPDAFSQPTFYARGAELAQLLQVSEKKAAEASTGYSNQVQRTLSGYAALLQTGANLPAAPEAGEPDAVLLSDLHGNPLVFDPFQRLFAGHTVFFAGDLGSSGTAAEASVLVPRLVKLGKPVVAVSGNHDSALIMRRLAKAGAIVLTETGRLGPDGRTDAVPVQRIGKLRVAGYSDPLEWHGANPGDPERVFSFSERPDGTAEYQRAQDDLVRWFDGLPERPDVVMVHENGLAQHLASTLAVRKDPVPLLILTGHDHRQHVDIHGKTIVADAGTAGAGGIFGVGTQFVGVATFQLDHGEVPPRAIDLIRVDPISGAAQADRVVPSSPAACQVERVVCQDERQSP